MYGYTWTEENGIFRLSIDAGISKEIRPVFREELDFFGMDQYWDYPKDSEAPLMWAEGVRRYIYKGQCVAEARGGGFYTKPVIELQTEERLQLEPVNLERLYEVNKQIMLGLEQKAVYFIQEQHKHYLQQGFFFVCAFSGGKDSLVLLDLMTKALAPQDYYVIFSNTGMELSSTLEAVEKAKQRWPELRFEEAKCHLNAEETWDEFGPPATNLRWCCSVRKSVPTLMLLSEIIGSKDIRAVVYDGVRAEESLRRSKYTEIGESVKNVHQINCHALLNWSSSEVFVYALKNNILFNNAYRLGIYRVGCKICPMSAKWQDALIAFNYPQEIQNQLTMLEDMTIFAKGKLDKKYIEDGGWQARTGGRILKQGENRVTEEIGKNSITFCINNAKQDWNSVIPIWGIPISINENGTSLRTKNGVFEMNVSKGCKNYQEIRISPISEIDRFSLAALRGIANKVAYCVGCKACVVQCPNNAYQIIDGKILIRPDRCVHCYKCCTYTNKGCMVAKSLSLLLKGDNMRNPDRYRNFGFREHFYSHYLDKGSSCFDLPDSERVLGKDQYRALKQWLGEAGILKTEVKGSRTIIKSESTDLGKKLVRFGSNNLFAWAIIWANLAYNSTVVRAFCLNVGLNSDFTRDFMYNILEYDNKKANSQAVNSLLSTFRDSPIGSALQQGVQQDKSYYRQGWEYPHAVALLYSIYLYAEHIGCRSFTFGDMIKAHDNQDGAGISPSDIYGISPKNLKQYIQGLADSYSKYIHVSFVDNLDNIILENYSSDDIVDLAEE
ncbi:MAG: phosphoadenosine phosphosulfate reductase family protein [Candidatus Bruticola sp.]